MCCVIRNSVFTWFGPSLEVPQAPAIRQWIKSRNYIMSSISLCLKQLISIAYLKMNKYRKGDVACLTPFSLVAINYRTISFLTSQTKGFFHMQNIVTLLKPSLQARKIIFKTLELFFRIIQKVIQHIYSMSGGDSELFPKSLLELELR